MGFVKIPEKYESIFSRLEKRKMVLFSPSNGEMGYFRRLEKVVNQLSDSKDFSVVYDRKHNLGVLMRKRSKFKRKRYTARRKKKRHVLFEIG